MKAVGLSERRSCALTGQHRSVYRYQAAPTCDEALRVRLKELARHKRRYGTPRLTYLIRKEFGAVNHKRIERIYREEGLTLPRKRKSKGRGPHPRRPLVLPSRPNERWSQDFMCDSFGGGGRFRTFNLIDDYSRECLAIEVDTSLSGERIVRVLQRVARERGLPDTIVMDNGPEFTSRALLAWRQETEVNLHFIQPGKPMENAIVESFNGKVRDECLNQHYFVDLGHVRRIIEEWSAYYNTRRPHTSLGFQTPEEYRKSFEGKNSETTMNGILTQSSDLT